MTVGIILNNEHSGIAIADSRIMINDQREGDMANKLITILAKDYEGAMVGAGDSYMISSLLKHAKNVKEKKLEDFLKNVRDYWFDMLEDIKRQLLESEMKEAMNINKLLDEKKDYVPPDFTEREDLEEFKEITNSECTTVFFDKKEGRVRKYDILPHSYIEDSSFESVIGSGSDAAGLEFLKLMPGVPLDRLKLNEITFIAMCAYVRATQNIGVGFTPKIALISNRGTRKVQKETAITLANLIGAYTAEIISRDYAENQVTGVLNEKTDYRTLGKKLGLHKHTLQNYQIPLDSWLSYANGKRYRR